MGILFSLVAINTKAQSIQPEVLSTSGGRYVFGQISSFRSDQYMLDTQTGRLWEAVTSTNGAVSLQEVPYVSTAGVYSVMPKTPQEEEQELVNAVQAAKNGQQSSKP